LKFVKYLSILVVLNLALVSNVSAADTTDLKIGIVDRQVLMQDSLVAKNVIEKMKKDFTGRESAMMAKQKVVMAKYEDLERNKDVLSEAERAKKEKELIKLDQDFKQDMETFQADVTQRQEKEGVSLEKLINDALAEISKEEKLDLIIHQQAIAFSGRKLDYTYKALQLLDKRYKESKK